MFWMRKDRPSESRCLGKLDRIALWNKEKIAVIIAMGIWLTEVAFLLNGKCLIHIMGEPAVNLVILQASYG